MVLLARPIDFRIRRERFFHEASQLLFIGGMFLDRFDDDAVNRTIRVFRDGAQPARSLGGSRIVVVSVTAAQT